MAEVAAAGARGQDQVVVAEMGTVENDALLLWIQIHHLPKQHLHVLVFREELAQRDGDIGFGDQSRGHLIEHGLEEIEIALVDQRHPHGLTGEAPGGLDAGEPSSHDHHMGPGLHAFLRRLQLEEKALGCHGRRGCDIG
jgi:hypothetical protein